MRDALLGETSHTMATTHTPHTTGHTSTPHGHDAHGSHGHHGPAVFVTSYWNLVLFWIGWGLTFFVDWLLNWSWLTYLAIPGFALVVFLDQCLPPKKTEDGEERPKRNIWDPHGISGAPAIPYLVTFFILLACFAGLGGPVIAAYAVVTTVVAALVNNRKNFLILLGIWFLGSTALWLLWCLVGWISWGTGTWLPWSHFLHGGGITVAVLGWWSTNYQPRANEALAVRGRYLTPKETKWNQNLFWLNFRTLVILILFFLVAGVLIGPTIIALFN